MHRPLALLCLASLAALPSCAPPKGQNTGRIEVSDTTRAEARSPGVMPVALIEFSDQVAQELAADLTALPEFNTGSRVTLVFGDIANKTGIVSTTDFEAFRTRVRSKLMTSQTVRDKVRFVENRARVDDLRRREQGSSQDLLQEDGRSGRARLNERYTYFLDGDMYRVARGGDTVNMYLLNFNLTNMADGEIVWSNSPYEIKQER